MKLHPASIPYRSFSRSLSAGSLFFFIGVISSPGEGGANLILIAAMVLFGILLGVIYEVAYYRRFRYELTADSFDVASGVISRRDREVPIRRIQNVDIRQNVFQRAIGIAAVHVESAGGGQTEITLQYVDEAEAKRLQRQLRHGDVASERSESESDSDSDSESDSESEGTDDPTQSLESPPHSRREETELFAIQPRELAILSVFTIDPGASLLGGIALSFLSGFDPVQLIPLDLIESDLPGTGLFAIAWAVLLFLLAAWIISALLTFTRYYGFRLTRVGDELHYERGLLQRYSGTIPLDKVQTLTIKQSVPFRWFGYGSLAVETAGYAPGQSGSRGAESAVPLAKQPRVLELARSVEPFEEGALESSPSRARERYAVRYLGVAATLIGIGYLISTALVAFDWYFIAAILLLVPIGAHLKWTSRGYRAGESYFFAQTGFWRRTTKVVPYYRIQSVINSQTIFQRRRRLATVTADTASSASFFGRAATAIDLDSGRGATLQEQLGEELQAELRARGGDRSLDILESGSVDSGFSSDSDSASGSSPGPGSDSDLDSSPDAGATAEPPSDLQSDTTDKPPDELEADSADKPSSDPNSEGNADPPSDSQAKPNPEEISESEDDRTPDNTD